MKKSVQDKVIDTNEDDSLSRTFLGVLMKPEMNPFSTYDNRKKINKF